MALPAAGCSPRPLSDKLGFRPGMAVAFAALPAGLDELATATPFARVERFADWSGVAGDGSYDAVHAFTTRRAEIADHLPGLQSAIRPDGIVWVSWPKKAARVATDVTEDVVRGEALKLDLVDVKVAAIDAVWSGLKLVIRKERRAGAGH